jgi:hypothetical protein
VPTATRSRGTRTTATETVGGHISNSNSSNRHSSNIRYSTQHSHLLLWVDPLGTTLGGLQVRRSRPCRSDRHALLILRRAPKTLGFLVFGLPLPQTTSPSPHRGARHEPLRGGAGPPSGCHPPTLVYDSKTDLDRAGHQASQYVIGRKSTRMDDTGRRGSDHSTIHMLREPPAADGGQRKIDMGRR